MQMCWVVPDIDAAMAQWARTAGVGPFFYFGKVPFVDPIYRGKPGADIDFTAAIAQAGDVQIELVCQKDNTPSIWRDVVPAGQSGFHHAALYCQDYDATLAAYAAEGAELALSIKMMGARTSWLDTTPSLGFMVELIEANPIADSIFGQIRAAGEAWDGTNPVRTLS
jgi:hypothetical protein